MTAQKAQSAPTDPPHAGGYMARFRAWKGGSDAPSGNSPNLRAAIAEETGATMLEWALLLAAIGIPSYYVIRIALDTLTGYYAMMTTLNGLPLP